MDIDMVDSRKNLAAVRRRIRRARNFQVNTCPASRHLQMIGENLARRKPYPMLDEEPEQCAEAMLYVVAALYEARTKLAEFDKIKAELNDMQATFDLRWKADMRGDQAVAEGGGRPEVDDAGSCRSGRVVARPTREGRGEGEEAAIKPVSGKKLTRSQKKLRQLRWLFARQGGLCHWCEVVMQPPGTFKPKNGVPTPPRLCTLEHLDDRFSPDRGKRVGEFRRVAACHACNHARGLASQAAQPIEVLRARSGHTPPPPPRQKGRLPGWQGETTI